MALRATIVNTATLIYNHPSFCKEGDFQMSAAYCFSEHLNTKKKYLTTDTWSYIINEIEFMMMINAPKISKGQLIPVPPPVLTLDDMPFDIQEKIYIIKHKLQLSDVLRQFMYRHKRYLSKVKAYKLNTFKFHRYEIPFRTYTKNCNDINTSLSQNIYKPFQYISRCHANFFINRSIYPFTSKYTPSNKMYAYSRLSIPSWYAPSSKNGCLMRLSKIDLQSLCSDNQIPYKSRDSKKILAKLLMSI